MANFADFSPTIPAMPSGLYDVQTIWEMGSAGLLQNNNQLIVPERVAATLNEVQVNELRVRLR